MNRTIIDLKPYTIEYQPIPIIGSYYDYVNVNNDKYLRKSMIKYFREKTQGWLVSDFDANECFIIRCLKAPQDSKNAISVLMAW